MIWLSTAIALLLAISVRLVILVTSRGMMDGDEAVLGIQAEQILHGAHPIYFAGQPYMGSWDAYLAAPLVALLGPSAWPLHLVTLTESLLLVPLLGALAAHLYGARARLPAMLLAAIPAEYVAVGELRMLGGYVETLVLGTALLLLATQVRERWRSGRPTLIHWILIGFLTGLALWIDTLIAYYLVAGLLWLLPDAIARVRKGWAEGQRGVRATLTAGLAWCAALAIGATPAIIYAVQNRFANVTVVITQPEWLRHVSPIRGSVLVYLVTHDIPSIIGIRLPWRVPLILGLPLGVVAGTSVLAALVYTLWRVCASGVTQRRVAALIAGIWAHWNDMLPLLLFGVIIIIYWRSSATALVYMHPAQDAGGRYVLPATTAFSLLLVRLYLSLPQLLPRLRTRHRGSGRQVWLAPALLGLLLLVNAIPYVVSDNVDAMQSPETHNMVFPVGDTGLLTYLNQHHIAYVWSNHWMCHLIMYLEDQRVTCGEYVDVYILQHVQSRFPDAMAATAAADRPSFVITADPSQGEPAVERALDALGVTYTSAHFGAIWIVTPLSRTVAPQEIAAALVADY